MGLSGYGRGVADEEIRTLLDLDLEIRLRIKDLCDHISSKSNAMSLSRQEGLFLAEAFDRYSSRQSSSFRNNAIVAMKLAEIQRVIENSESKLNSFYQKSIVERFTQFVKNEVREARYAHIDYVRANNKLQDIEKQITSESKKGTSSKLQKLQETKQEEQTKVTALRESVILKMKSVVETNKTLPVQLLECYLDATVDHFVRVTEELNRIKKSFNLENKKSLEDEPNTRFIERANKDSFDTSESQNRTSHSYSSVSNNSFGDTFSTQQSHISNTNNSGSYHSTETNKAPQNFVKRKPTQLRAKAINLESTNTSNSSTFKNDTNMNTAPPIVPQRPPNLTTNTNSAPPIVPPRPAFFCVEPTEPTRSKTIFNTDLDEFEKAMDLLNGL